MLSCSVHHTLNLQLSFDWYNEMPINLTECSVEQARWYLLHVLWPIWVSRRDCRHVILIVFECMLDGQLKYSKLSRQNKPDVSSCNVICSLEIKTLNYPDYRVLHVVFASTKSIQLSVADPTSSDMG